MCGGPLELPEGITYAECPYCGSAATFPKISNDHKESLYNRAEDLRRANDFDKALQAYEKILETDDTDPEIYWGMVLCRYGIEYVEDPVSHERIPTCHRVQLESILQDNDYRQALEHAAGYESAYEAEAQKIAEIQKRILAVSASEEPFDIFICYKEASDAGTRTKDSTIAQDIYYQLTNEGYRVFFARITLEDKIGQEYEPYIFAALNSAKVMLVIGSRKEYFEAVWVKNEWSRFLALMKKDHTKMLIPCYKDMDAYDIPAELSMLQSQDMSKIGFIQDLLRGIKKVLTPAAQAEGTSPGSSASEIQKLLKLAQNEKELDNHEAVYDIGIQITEIDVDNIDGWYLQACSCGDMDRSIKLFEKIIKMKPDCAEYYISAAKELSCFAEEAEDHFNALLDARDAYDDFVDEQGDDYDDEDDEDDDIIEGPEWDEFNECFDACDADVKTLEFCVAKLSSVIDNKVPGVKFSENDKAEAKKQAIEILDQLIDLKTQLRDEEIYCMILDEKEEKKELDSLAELILMRSVYSSEKLTPEVFFNAVMTGNLTTVKKFTDDGGDINITDENGDTPLALAILAGFDNIAELLLQKGANANAPSGAKKFYPLHIVFGREKGDNCETVKKLLEYKADPNALCADGNTPLSLAFALREIRISAASLAYLLQAGANPDYTVGNYTPLLRAVQSPDKFELVKLLLEYGANFNITAKTSGGTPMDYAKGAENISLLTQVGCQKVLTYDPAPKDAAIARQKLVEKVKKSTPVQILDITLGSYDASTVTDQIVPLSEMNGDELTGCNLAADVTIANRSNKEIKYIYLDLQAVNQVDDLISKITTIPLTGPIAPGASMIYRLDPLTFETDFEDDEPDVDCTNIADVDICGAEVEFMDGEIVEVSGEAMTLEMESAPPPPPKKTNISESVNTYKGTDFAHAVRWLSIIIAIGGIVAILTAFRGETLNASLFFGGIIAFVFGGAIWHTLKRPCPRCKRDNALEAVDSEEISHTPAYLKKDSDNKLGIFYKVRKNVTYQCRFCGYVEQCEETDEEQLN